MSKKRRIVLIFGDQLSLDISSLAVANKARDIVVMAEVDEEATYVRHHKKKIALVFSAMRHFAAMLKAQGWRVAYTRLDDSENPGSIDRILKRICDQNPPTQIIVTEPGEYRVEQALTAFADASDLELVFQEDSRFICSKKTFRDWADGRKQLRLENFYRDMRRKTGLLMSNDKPVGGRWNFDRDNRLPFDGAIQPPKPFRAAPDAVTREVLDLVETRFSDHFGTLEPFKFAVTHQQAEWAADHFLEYLLPNFGPYQDAMDLDHRFLFHSVLSPYLNIGLLDALDLCRRAEEKYRTGDAPLSSVEGFIRQIIGWREFVRGVYWLKMPSYADANFFRATRPLPAFYWTGETEMACLKAAINQTIDDAYAHHIQRLMITGNFAMLVGTDPHAVHEWYLSVYADAYEWVEMPNTLGMSQFADGGVIASKPYAPGGNYINRMSNYCKTCCYKVRQKTGEAACPFNYLYWDFMARHQPVLANNPRLGPLYRTWQRMSQEKQSEYRKSAASFLAKLDEAGDVN